MISHHRLKCIRKPFAIKKKTVKESLIPSLIIWPSAFLFWSIPIYFVVKSRNNVSFNINKKYMNSNECYFMYSFEYVLFADLVAYVTPISLLIYFQLLIYRSLKGKKQFINPLIVNSISSIVCVQDSDKDGKIDSRQLKRNISFLSNEENVSRAPTSSPITLLDIDQATAKVHRKKKFFGSNFSSVNPIAFDKKEANKVGVNRRMRRRASLRRDRMINRKIPSKKDLINSKDKNNYINNNNNNNNNKKMSIRPSSTNFSLSYFSPSLLNLTNYNYNSDLAKNKKVFKTLLFVSAFLIVFWAPWIISWPIDAYCKCIPRRVYSITYWMEYFNSFSNPIILIVCNQHFRAKFLALFSH
jgi:hypothetical protein